ncbi:MAG: filamentous hemagglutinin N-terminal domain-containing protein [Cyanobacteria bacterium P01_H01_bin.105]
MTFSIKFCEPRWRSLWIGVVLSALPLPGMAQLPTTDGSTNTQITPTVAGFDITGRTVVQQDLGNQFHSFESFNVSNGQTANFIKFSPDVDNIITRVTGESVSNIDGLIRANDANLFLINSNGLVFGPEADLEIGRSFFAATASNLLFSDGTLFDSLNPTTGEFTGSIPVAFGFAAGSGEITAVGDANTTIDVNVERTLALVGSRVTLRDFNLNAPTGRVELLGFGDQPTVVALTTVPININEPDRRAIGLSFDTPLTSSENGIVSLTNSTISTTADIASDFQSSSLFDTTGSFGFNSLNNAGGIVLRATNSIVLDQESTLQALSIDQGNAGFIGLQTNIAGEVQLQDGSILFASVEQAGGQGGFVFVDTGSLTLTDASQIQTSVRDNVNSPETSAGTTFIRANERVTLVGSDPFFGTSIFSSVGNPDAINTSANGGLILIDAGSLEIDGRDGFAGVTASNNGQGGAGFIFIDVENDVILRGDRAGIASETASSIPETSSVNDQQPGLVLIEARRVGTLNGASIRVDNRGTGEPGLISIKSDLIASNRSGAISARSTSGEGGLILLDSEFLALANNSNITTFANTDDANNGTDDPLKGVALFTDFEVIASPSFDNNISTNAEGSGAQAGNVFFVPEEGIAPPFLRNIAIRTQDTVNNNDITFQGTEGASDGRVIGAFSEFSSFQPTAEPPPNIVDPSRLIAQGCGVGDLTAAQNIGDLSITSRSGLSATPEEQITSSPKPTELADLSPADIAQAEENIIANAQDETSETIASNADSPIEAQTWRYGSNGTVMLMADATQDSTYSPVFSRYSCDAL